MLRDNARHKNVPPSLDLTGILKSYHKMLFSKLTWSIS